MERDDRIRSLLDEGLMAYGLGRLDEARRAWLEVLALEPGNARAIEYLRFLDQNWSPNQEREVAPYRPDEGSDPTAEVTAPASPAPAIRPRPLVEVVKLPAPDPPAFVAPVKPQMEAAAWGDLYDWAGREASGPPPAPAGAVPAVTPAIELKPLPAPPRAPPAPSPPSLPPLPELTAVGLPAPAVALDGPAPVQARPPPGLVVASAFSRPPTLEDIQPLGPAAPRPATPGLPPAPAAPVSALGLVAGGAAATGPEPPDDVGALIRGARELLELDDFSGVLELTDKVLLQDGTHQEALFIREQASHQLERMFASKVGELSRIPRVCMSQDEFIWLNLDHRAGFVLSLVDGRTSFEDVITVSGLAPLDAFRILAQLLQEKVIEVD
jgi:hypothetical protein